MKRTTPITTLFLDLAGVLLTDGWNHHARKRAAVNFKLEWAEVEERHRLIFKTYEEGKDHHCAKQSEDTKRLQPG